MRSGTSMSLYDGEAAVPGRRRRRRRDSLRQALNMDRTPTSPSSSSLSPSPRAVRHRASKKSIGAPESDGTEKMSITTSGGATTVCADDGARKSTLSTLYAALQVNSDPDDDLDRPRQRSQQSDQGVPMPSNPADNAAEALLDDDMDDPEDNLASFEEQQRAELAMLDSAEAKAQRKLDELDILWQRRRATLRLELSHQKARRMQLEAELHALHNGLADDIPAAGPRCLRFVDNTVFMAFGFSVVLVNMITIFVEEWDHSYAKKLWLFEQFCLLWYVTELGLKLTYHQQRFLLDRPAVVALNWLDLGIVAAGVLDQWVVPSLIGLGTLRSHDSTDVTAQGPLLKGLRLLRVARLARVLRILRIFLTVDLSWTEQPRFQTFIMGTIALNSAILGLETDYPWDGWFWSEQVMLIIFFFEIAVRLKRWGMNFFVHPEDWAWNNLDFLIVAGGVVDQWMMPIIAMVESLVAGHEIQHSTKLGHLIQLLRLMRIVRILRLVRLVRAVRPLYKLMTGVIEAVQGMQWVMILTVLLLYAFSLLATRLVGHGLLFGGLSHAPKGTRELFPSVPESMFLLFRVMNGSQSDLDPFFEASPVLKLAFVVFIIVANWAILAILTAVVSENMIRATEAAELSEASVRNEEMREANLARLERIFNTIDMNHDGVIDWEEYQVMLRDESIADQLCEIARLSKDDLDDLFLVLSRENAQLGGRIIRLQDFVTKMQTEDAAVKERTVFRLEQEVRRLDRKINRDIWDLRKKVLGLRQHSFRIPARVESEAQ